MLSDPLEIQEFMKHTIYRAKGCEFCGNTGYKGRTAVLEILVVNHGMKTLQVACLEHIKNGVTSIDEFVRTLGLAGE